MIENLIKQYLGKRVSISLSTRTNNRSNGSNLIGIGKVPLLCPECKTPLRQAYDRKFYLMYRSCMKCQIVKQSKKTEDEVKQESAQNIIEYLLDVENQMYAEVDSFGLDYLINEFGDKEEYEGGITMESFKKKLKDEFDVYKQEILKQHGIIL